MCALWGVDFNALTLINLIAAIGLSIEFTGSCISMLKSLDYFLFRSYGEDICTDNKVNKKRKSHWDYGSHGSCCYAWCCVYEFTRHYLPSLGIRNDFYFYARVDYQFFIGPNAPNRLNSKILKSTNYRNFLLPNEFRYNFGWNRSWVDFHSSYIGILRSQCKQSIAVWAATRGY